MDQSPASYQVTPSPISTYGQSPALLNTGFMGQSPMTPGGFQPQTPGAGLESYPVAEWHTTGIEVSIKESHPEAGLRRQIGIIRNINVS
jgi:hypothetical protein